MATPGQPHPTQTKFVKRFNILSNQKQEENYILYQYGATPSTLHIFVSNKISLLGL